MNRLRHLLHPLSRREVLAGSAAGAAWAIGPGCGPTPGPIDPADAGLEDAGLGDAGPLAAGTADAGLDAGPDGGPTPQCLETAYNDIGPCYRSGAPLRTLLAEASDGEPLVITGTVAGTGCQPTAGALLDVWHASAQGVYDLARCGWANDDPNFRWRGRMLSGNDGRYRFETILPGRFPNGNTFRPRHVHLKCDQTGFVSLTTQIYFKGDPFLATDPLVRSSLIIELARGPGVWNGTPNTVWSGTFDIVLARV